MGQGGKGGGGGGRAGKGREGKGGQDRIGREGRGRMGQGGEGRGGEGRGGWGRAVGICRLLPNIISSQSWLISSCKKRWTCELSLPPYKHLTATMFVTFLTDVLDPRLFSELKVKPFLQKYIHFFTEVYVLFLIFSASVYHLQAKLNCPFL